jgi:hypothetical protein
MYLRTLRLALIGLLLLGAVPASAGQWNLGPKLRRTALLLKVRRLMIKKAQHELRQIRALDDQLEKIRHDKGDAAQFKAALGKARERIQTLHDALAARNAHLGRKGMVAALESLKAQPSWAALIRTLVRELGPHSIVKVLEDPAIHHHLRLKEQFRLWQIENAVEMQPLLFSLSAMSDAMSGIAGRMEKMTATLKERMEQMPEMD